MNPETVRQSVEALSVAGPWIGLLLVAAGYWDLRMREARCRESTAAIEKRAADAIDTLNRRVDELHEKRLADSERDAATLLAHAQAMGKIVEGVTAAVERLSERVR